MTYHGDEGSGLRDLGLLCLIVGLVLLIGAQVAHCQSMSDAPSEQRQKKCGPWDCYDARTQLTWRETFADKKWQISTASFLLATAYDYTMTVRGTDRKWQDGTPVCVEGNHDLPLRPTAGDVAKDFAKTHLPVLVMGTAIHKVTGRSKWASWIYPAMMAYGTQMHIRSAQGWWACQ